MTASVHIAFMTFNRLEYTKRSLASVLADSSEQFTLTIWDNGSTDGTAEFLRDEISDPRIDDIILSPENVGQTAAVNKIWDGSKADLLAKVDNDCLMTAGWTRTLAQAHEDITNLGAVACWHFFADDFDYKRAKGKIEAFGRHQIFRHPWTCGSGVMFKRDDFRRFGPLPGRAMTRYWLNMALAGRVNGFYYPLVYQEHMDDPKSQYCLISDEASFAKYRHVTFGLGTGRYHDVAGRLKVRDDMVRNLLDDPINPRCYVGWRAKVRRLRSRLSRLVCRRGARA